MKNRVTIISIVLLLAFIVNSSFARTTKDFNFGWKFYLGDASKAFDKTYDDSDWRLLNLPHDWSIELDYTTEKTSGSTAFLPAGIGWYRKTFNIDRSAKDSLVNIEFDGVYKNAEVWINGQYLGIRPYGYSPFAYDLTPYLIYGEANTIAVKVDHENYADSRWYAGSGIYRNVRLVTTSKVFIPQFGSWIETPVVSAKKSSIKLSTVIENNEDKHQKVLLQVNIFDESNNIVAKKTKTIKVIRRDTVDFVLSIEKPSLWSIDDPKMYRAEINLLNKKEVLDVYSIDFGIRDIQFTADQGFFLNNENIKLKGVCLHHDAGAVGSIFIRDVWKRRLNKLKEIGVNAIRSSHNPMDPGLLTLCDEMGFVVINEAFDEWRRNKNKWITSRFSKDMRPELETGYGDIYEEWAERDAKDMVRSTRNHPSIIMWSLGNEIEWTYPYYWKMEQSNQGLGNQVLLDETGDGVDELKETAVEIQKWIKEIDQSRLVTSGGVLPKAGNISGYFDVPDAMGYNYRAKNYDEDHKNYPNRIIYGSENWGRYHEWKNVVDRDFVFGIFVWTGIAYLGESGPFPWKGLDISFLDFCGFYTPRGHFFKTLWHDEPHTYIATKNAKEAQWIKRKGQWIDNRVDHWLEKWLFEDVSRTWNYATGDSVFVEVYSNSPEVELFINNESFGVVKPSEFDDHIAKFLVPYSEGEVKAVGLRNGTIESEHQIKTSKWVSKIELVADREIVQSNGYDIIHIEAFVKGGSNEIVPDNDMQIEFVVEGEGVNIAVDNGWDRNVQKHKSNYIVTHNGRAMMLVQSTKKAGDIKISARAGKLKSNEIIIQSH